MYNSNIFELKHLVENPYKVYLMLYRYIVLITSKDALKCGKAKL